MIGSGSEVLVSIVLGLSFASMGMWAIVRGPFLKRNQRFMFIAMVSAMMSLTTTSVLLLSDEEVVLWALRADTFLVTIFFGTLFYLVLMQPHRRFMIQGPPRRLMEAISRPEVLAFVVAVSATIPAAFVSVSAGPETHISDAMLPMSIVLTVYLVAIMSLLTIALLESDDRKTKTEFLVMSGASLSPFIISLPLTLFAFDVATFGQWLMPGMLVSLMVMMIHLMRSPSQTIDQMKEDLDLGMMIEQSSGEIMEEGCCLLVESKGPDRAFQMFKDRLSHGYCGLVISRTHPDRVREDYALGQTPVIWLASQPGPDRVDPTNLSILQNTIVDFIRRSENSAIIFEGLEYIISNNSIEKVLRMFYLVKDEMMFRNSQPDEDSEALLIMPLDIEVLSPRELALFEREFDIYRISKRKDQGAGTEI